MALVLVVAECNLTNKLKTNSNSNSSSSASSNQTKIGDDPVEKPAPTSAQMAAIANGQDVKWDQQGISWTLPAGWKKQDVSTNSFSYGGDGGVLFGIILPMGPDFSGVLRLYSPHGSANGRREERALGVV